MSVPIQITFHGIDPSDAMSDLIVRESAKLEGIFSRIVRCHVTVEREERHLRNGAPFRVRIDLTVPGAEIAVDTARSLRMPAADEERPMRRKSAEIDAIHKDPALTIRDAFRRARRRLQDRVRRRSGS